MFWPHSVIISPKQLTTDDIFWDNLEWNVCAQNKELSLGTIFPLLWRMVSSHCEKKWIVSPCPFWVWLVSILISNLLSLTSSLFAHHCSGLRRKMAYDTPWNIHKNTRSMSIDNENERQWHIWTTLWLQLKNILYSRCQVCSDKWGNHKAWRWTFPPQYPGSSQQWSREPGENGMSSMASGLFKSLLKHAVMLCVFKVFGRDVMYIASICNIYTWHLLKNKEL